MDPLEFSARWKQMSVFRLLSTLGATAAAIGALAYITTSAATGFGLLMGLGVAWMAFASVMSFGAVATILVKFIVDLMMLFLKDDEIRERIYWGLRWATFMTGMGFLLWSGGRGVYDGLENNRLVESKVLYERCMEPKMRTVKDRWQACSDGWESSSIGLSGACSRHGGVVWRMVERQESYLPQTAEYCRDDASARSWLN